MLSGDEALRRYRRALPGVGDRPVHALARAIAASPGWPAGCGAVLLARESPAPALAVLGRFDEEGTAWLHGQARALHDACRRLRAVDPATLAEDCARLAEALHARLGPGALPEARLLAIPRGGRHVLKGLERLLGGGGRGRTLIVVDDCALSGARFHQFLRTVPGDRIVFAPLYSHPELRAAIVRREPRVACCLSARDLAGQRLAAQPGAADSWYWSGHVEPLCFPWNEPDRTFWNPAAGRWELAWRIVPPELCPKNRPPAGAAPIPVQAH